MIYATVVSQERASEVRRALITEVPGSGPVRGVAVYNNKVYAWRDDAGGTPTKCDVYESSASGWQFIFLTRQLSFNLGTAAFVEGEVVTGATSGAFGTLERMSISSGDWSTNDAAGELYLSGIVGAFSVGEIITSASGSATTTTTDTQIWLTAGHRVETIEANFFGTPAGRKLYGVNAYDKAWEFDGTTLSFITTGVTVDSPDHIAEWNNYLWVSFDDHGSVQRSPLADPMALWTPILGAGQISLGVQLTGMLPLVGDRLGIFGEDRSNMILDDGAGNFIVDEHSRNIGALEYTIKSIGNDTIFKDRHGVTSMSATDVFGDFSGNSISTKIDPLIDTIGSDPVASISVRDDSQYWLFFNNGTDKTICIVAGFDGNKLIGFTPVNYPFSLSCVCRGIIDGQERVFCGSDTGMVYELQSGPSYDGDVVPANLKIPFNHLKYPRYIKRFRKAIFDIDITGFGSFYFQPEFDYMKEYIPISTVNLIEVSGGGGIWDTSAWDEFIWDLGGGSAEIDIDGQGLAMSVNIYSEMDFIDPHTIESYHLHYDLRRLKR